MSNYPPGVTGNEPQITGEWPCYCASPPEHDCPLCGGSGIMREEVQELADLKQELTAMFRAAGYPDPSFDTDDDYLAIHTNFRVVGDLTILEDDEETTDVDRKKP